MSGFFANLKLLWPWSRGPRDLTRFDELLDVVRRDHPRAQLQCDFWPNAKAGSTTVATVRPVGPVALFAADREAADDLARRCRATGYAVERLSDGGVRVAVRSRS